jgi:hypothetical protein
LFEKYHASCYNSKKNNLLFSAMLKITKKKETFNLVPQTRLPCAQSPSGLCHKNTDTASAIGFPFIPDTLG